MRDHPWGSLILRRSFLVSLGMLVGMTLAGVAGYMAIEGWPLIDAIWMVVITLTTIGYGEVRELSVAGRVFTVLLITGGVGTLTYTLTQLSRAVAEGEVVEAWRKRRRRRLLAELSDHYIVVGHGKLGHVVVTELLDADVDVCVIERDGDVARTADLGSRVVVIQGDGADDHVLRLAGVESARGLAVTSPAGAEAIFITLSARQLNPGLPIVTRVDSDQDAIKARRAGATGVVSPDVIGGWRIAHGLSRPHTANFLDLATLSAHEGVVLDELIVDEDCAWRERSLADLAVGRKHQVLVVAVRRGGTQMVAVPSGSPILHAGDVLIVIGAPDQVRRFEHALTSA